MHIHQTYFTELMFVRTAKLDPLKISFYTVLNSEQIKNNNTNIFIQSLNMFIDFRKSLHHTLFSAVHTPTKMSLTMVPVSLCEYKSNYISLVTYKVVLLYIANLW